MKYNYTLTIAALLIAVLTGPALAQQKQQVSFTVPAENSKITKQQNVEVGDVPNHIVRVYENHQTFMGNVPVVNGVKVIEIWARGITDFIETNGPGTQYLTFMMDNGDRVFARLSTMTQTVAGKPTSTLVGPITNGTGRFAGIQGTIRATANLDYAVGAVTTRYDIDYSVK
jgi:archaellum component FlaG (FlaF/FlaG flagellin family)